MSEGDGMSAEGMRELLRALPVFPERLPEFDTSAAPAEPVVLFLWWLREAVETGVLGPHAMTLSTADAEGRPASRVLICKDVGDDGRWYFASSANSLKGRHLAVNPSAALTFYWPALGRQIRIRGSVAPAGETASAADFLARHPDSRAEALIGRQSEVLDDPADLDEASARAQAMIAADPGLVAPSWTLYAVTAGDVEFWQAGHDRRHIRLRYERGEDAWTRHRLWP
ncbi:pyridoxal 5'-phosphate synthase [Spongiactinospora sp. TRM90649]|uniref:pyridoxine/pyridoxamine 5'-phosphate oxidase n=1 Tax=Spongiactinospora sp. TRM90649 TaxID=3031114 RepID=UPI0023F761C0|nr:pyridoxal 5'-phosphate synthase [Spongiactinospora sp. TRM90649]MDF5758000.1 pyridoxal 5'-phosphate synthase [Spongiactinospora sp. TRM90649]